MSTCLSLSSPPAPAAQYTCFCQQAPQLPPRCRRPGSEGVRFPEACPENDVLMPLPEFAAGNAEQRGMPLTVVHEALKGIQEVRRRCLCLCGCLCVD